MPSVATPQRRGREEESDNAEGIPAVGSTTQSNSRSSKRSRLNLNGDASPAQSPLLPGGFESASNGSRAGKPLQRGNAPTKHQPGSIVRVKLTNFVTYTAVEFFPGPSLNMVIGPNGTGKSTLVCAICLGLGWGPQHLGRAKEVSEFVKHGSQDATIEIELAGRPNKRNPVIRCNIKREGNKTTFDINGSPSNKKKVVELARSYSIQIDNLCQFLPQDKVVEFAAMTPVELLRSTQRAVASQEMLDWHESLKDLRAKQRTVEAQKTSDAENLANLEGRQRMQEADVERMRTRELIKERVRLLEISRPFPEYREARIKHTDAKEQRKKAAIELHQLEQDVEPTLRAVNSKQLYRDRVKHVVDERGKLVDKAERKAHDYSSKIQRIDDNITELENQKEAEKKGVKNSRQEASRLEGVVRGLKVQMEQQPPEFDVGEYNERIRKMAREVEKYIDEAAELGRAMRGVEERGKERNDRIQRAEHDLEGLESKAGQQNNKLKNESRDSAVAWEWIQRNQDKFEKRVYGPPLVECSVKDPRYVDVVEAAFSKTDFICFTVQTRADFNTLHKTLHGEMRLSEINIRTMTGGLENFRPLVSQHELGRYGLEGWALDYVDGPEPVLAMLCSDGPRLQQTAVGLQDTTPQQYELLQNSPIACWVSRKSIYKINRRREYGPGAISTTVRDVRKARWWTEQPVDINAKRALQENIAGWREEVDAFLSDFQGMRGQIAELKKVKETVDDAKKQLENEKEEKQKAVKAFNALPTRLAGNKEKLADVQAIIDGSRARTQALDDNHDELALAKGQVALDYANAVEVLRKAHDDLYEAELMHIEANSDFEVLTERNRTIKNDLESKRKEVEEITKASERASAFARKQFAKCKALMAESDGDPVMKAFFEELPEKQTLEQLDLEIETEKARLELMHEGNGGIIREYEKRQQSIDALKTRLQDVAAGLDELTREITEIRSQWEPQLDRLVKRISDSFAYNMQQINCAGEVSVYKDEDFDQWAIQIQVKFRENEPLTILDSHRQSGGERAVSTIFYLMSLQTLTRSPFRVVDEINQGMDPRNERLVHARMVSIATGNDEHASTDAGDGADGGGGSREDSGAGGGSQYFLITPKLLHGLRYERGMRVLCIASGAYMPNDQSAVDFRACVDLRRGLVHRGVRAAG